MKGAVPCVPYSVEHPGPRDIIFLFIETIDKLIFNIFMLPCDSSSYSCWEEDIKQVMIIQYH